MNDRANFSGGGTEPQLPGQMNIYNFPEYLPTDMQEKVKAGVYQRGGYLSDTNGDLQRVQSSKE